MEDRLSFISQVVPFNTLPLHVLESVVGILHEIKYTKDGVIYKQESTPMKGIDVIVEGEYESYFLDIEYNKRLVDYHKAGNIYGGISILLNSKRSLRTVLAKKGTVVYQLPSTTFHELCLLHKDFSDYFTEDFARLMRNEEYAHFYKRPASFDDNYISTDQLYTKKIEDIEYREIISCNAHTRISEAASIMAKSKISCIFVTDEKDAIIGYVTDITLRNNVVITGRSVLDPVSDIMDNPIVSIKLTAYVYEAVLMMLLNKTRYMLVENNGKYVGYVSRNKLLSEQSQSPLLFIQSVKLAISDDELKRKWEDVPSIIIQLLDRGVNAEIVNQVITAIADTIALNVINQTIELVGEPPAKFVFMVIGSEGRKEQTLKTDQDNAIIYEDKANEQREFVREYFLRFSEIVSNRLNYIGFSFCTGGFMAKNPKWTHSLSHWKRNYESWINEMESSTVMKFSTFFDCRYLYGEVSLINELKEFMNVALQKPTLGQFYNHLATNALQYEPPLTFFKFIRTTKRGSQEVFDIKRAMTPIVDLVRIYALSNRIFEVNTGERLKALKERGVFTEEEIHELYLSYYLLMRLRLKSQARQIMQNKKQPDNYVSIQNLTKIELVTLKEIFKTIENFQKTIKIKFTNNLFGSSSYF